MLTPANTQLPPPADWQAFEHLCYLLWRAVWDYAGTQKHGRQGQPQHGVDVFGQAKNGNWSGVQCKGKDNFTAKRVTVSELRKEVRKAKQFKPPLSEFILAATCPRDATIQAEARRLTEVHRKTMLFSVRVVSWNDILDLLDDHHEVVAKVYPGVAVVKQTQSYSDNANKLVRTVLKRLSQHEKTLEATVLCTLHAQGQDLRTVSIPDVSQEQLDAVVSVLQGKPPIQKRPTPTNCSSSIAVLSPQRTKVLGILAVSLIPFSAAALKSIFPKVKWDTHLRYFKRHNLVELKDGKYSIPTRIAKSVAESDEERLPYMEQWIEALEPLKWHPDTALFLSIHLMSAGELKQSIDTLVDAAVPLLPGRWNETYLSILLNIQNPKLSNILTNDQQVRYLNSVALCLFRAKRYQESIEWFRRMLRLSKRARNNWGIGQSYHHSGIVYIEMGDLTKAESSLRNAVKHTKRTRDRFLLGRSLYELAVVIANSSEEEARALFAESERIKRKEKDEGGLVGINHGYAILALKHADYKAAIKWFKKAETAARKVGHYHAEALECFNVGRAYVDLGQHKEALPYLRRAKKIAQRDELNDVLMLAIGGESMALTGLNQYEKAEKLFHHLFELHSESGDLTNAAIALHDIGATLLGQKKYGEARKALRRAAQYARRNKVLDWAYQSQADIGQSYILEGQVEKAVSTLMRLAASEERRKLNEIAAKLRIDVIEFSIHHNISGAATQSAVTECSKMARRKTTPGPLRAQLLSTLYLWHWHAQDFPAGLRALRELFEYAKASRDRELACHAQDQLGVSLQELGQFKEAVSTHRAALKVARRLGDPESVETSLNNLGEALRKCARHAEAVEVLTEAETSARTRNDIESAISTAHNRALAYEQQDKFKEAKAIFNRCRDEARKEKLWHEYVRALHALANLAWHQGKSSLAITQYDRALKAADRYGSDTRHQICLNLSNALRWKEQPSRALKILSSALPEFQNLPDSHLYHTQLAILYDELGPKQLAERHWQLAYESARRVGDNSAIALSSGALAEAHDDSGALDKADSHYRTALRHEDDDSLKLRLLLERMGVLLQLKREKEATKVFEEIRRLSSKQKSDDEYIDALVMLGDYNWTDGEAPKEALKAYVAAMAACGSDDIQRYFDLGAMTTIRLLQSTGRNKSAEIKRLQDSTVHWLKHDQKLDADKQNGRLLLWPFQSALRLAESKGAKVVPEENEFAKVLMEEFEKTTALPS